MLIVNVWMPPVGFVEGHTPRIDVKNLGLMGMERGEMMDRPQKMIYFGDRGIKSDKYGDGWNAAIEADDKWLNEFTIEEIYNIILDVQADLEITSPQSICLYESHRKAIAKAIYEKLRQDDG